MIKTILCAALLGVVLFPVREDQSQITDNSVEPNRFYREFVGLTDEQIREIHEGKALAKILDSPTADQVCRFWLCLRPFDSRALPPIRSRSRGTTQTSKLSRNSAVQFAAPAHGS